MVTISADLHGEWFRGEATAITVFDEAQLCNGSEVSQSSLLGSSRLR